MRVLVDLWDGVKNIEEEFDVGIPSNYSEEQAYEYIEKDIDGMLQERGYSRVVLEEMEINFKISRW